MKFLPVSWEEFTKISVVVALHFHIKNFCVSLRRIDNERIAKKIDDILTNLIEFIFEFFTIPLDQVNILATFVFFLVLDSNDGAPGNATGAYRIFVCN